jgi:branched-chain amino acid transport system substrate-binding protein
MCKKSCRTGAGAFLFIGLLACGLILAGASPAGAQPKSVKIGALLTLTGSLAKAGEEIKEGITMAVEDVNKAGGIKALGGAKMEVAFADSQAKPDIASGETERLIEREKVIAIIDQYPSVATIAASAVGERLKTPFLAPISYADKLSERGFKYFFQQLGKTGGRGVGAAWYEVEYMDSLSKVSARKFNRVALIYEDTDYGQAGAAGCRKYAGEKGYKIVEDIPYPSRTPDVTPIVSKLKAAKPDVVLMVSYLGDSILMMKTADRLNFNVPWIDNTGKAHTSYIKAVGEIGEYDNVLGMWNKDLNADSKKLNDRFRARFKEDLTSHAALDYQAVWVLKEALELAKKAEREALREALTKVQINPGPTMILPFKSIKFGEDGVNTGGSFILTQIQNGEFVTVWPEKYAAGKVKISPKWWK